MEHAQEEGGRDAARRVEALREALPPQTKPDPLRDPLRLTLELPEERGDGRAAADYFRQRAVSRNMPITAR